MLRFPSPALPLVGSSDQAMEGCRCWAVFTKPAGFQPLKAQLQSLIVGSTGLSLPLGSEHQWWVAMGQLGGRSLFQLVFFAGFAPCCLLTTQTGLWCAHEGCLPAFALLRSLIPPGCIRGGDGVLRPVW